MCIVIMIWMSFLVNKSRTQFIIVYLSHVPTGTFQVSVVTLQINSHVAIGELQEAGWVGRQWGCPFRSLLVDFLVPQVYSQGWSYACFTHCQMRKDWCDQFGKSQNFFSVKTELLLPKQISGFYE
jgi:hypothetical protein